MVLGNPDGRIGAPLATGAAAERSVDASGRAGSGQELSAATRRAARDGVGRGLRAFYADSLDEPLPDDLRDLLGRFGAPSL